MSVYRIYLCNPVAIPPLALLASALFLPAMAGLLVQAAQPHPWPHRLLAIALLIMSFEQAHMARVDLRQIDAAQRRGADPRLRRFRQVVWGTVVGQVIGFSLAALGHLGWGMALILLSLVGFNLVASIRLGSESAAPVQAADWRSRLDVLALDAIALGLALLWIGQMAQPWVAAGLFAIAALYASGKLWGYIGTSFPAPSKATLASAVHISHPTQQHPQPPQQN